MTTTTTARRSSPPPADESAAPSKSKFSIDRGVQAGAERIVLYGVGGIGKSSLAALAPSPLFIDVDRGTRKIDVPRLGGISTFEDMLEALRDDSLWRGVRTTIVDSGTAAQELAIDYTIRTVKHENGVKSIKGLEDYGFGKGYAHVGDAFNLLIAAMDRHYVAGRNVILICHEVTERAPNPEGEDYLRNEPALQQPPKNGRVRDRVKNWCDHLLYLSYDKLVKDGKAKGQGTRTIYPTERPTYWAKSRSLRDPIPCEEGSDDVWQQLGLK